MKSIIILPLILRLFNNNFITASRLILDTLLLSFGKQISGNQLNQNKQQYLPQATVAQGKKKPKYFNDKILPWIIPRRANRILFKGCEPKAKQFLFKKCLF